MRNTPRRIASGLAGGVTVAVVLAVSAVGASGSPGVTPVPAAGGAAERVRLVGADTYQLSLDGGATWGRQLPAPRQIRLRNRTFDPAAGTDQHRSQGALRADHTGAYLVQFVATPLESQRAALRGLGARIGAYVPDAAYVVRMDEATRARVAALPYVRWVGAYDPGDRFPDGQVPTATHRYLITLVERNAADQRAVVDQLVGLGAPVHVVSASRHLVQATLTPAQAVTLAAMPQVLALDEWSAPATDMDKARVAGGANAIETAGGYSGQGVRGEVMDGGLLATHQEFAARPPVVHGANTTDISHGTSTYGEIFASGVDSTARGLLPQGQGMIATYTNVADRWAHTAELVDPAGPYQAVFQSNSWGSALTTSYTATSAEMDDIVFDHDILICQSQSNSGTTSSRPEAWAKNVVSVGGQYHYDTLSRTDDAWNGGASIGPAADGRIKPDLSNYYDYVHTTSSASNAAYTNTFNGTSAATPITCGHAGLVYQMWADGVFTGAPGQARNVFASRPHAATAKALMINSADQFTFSGTTADLTRVHQGWGTASVGNLYNQAKAGNWRLPVLVNEDDLLTVGQTRTYTITTDGTQPLRATMAYSDPAGSPTAAQARVNDLTLKVTAPNGTVYWGNNGLKAGNWSTSGGAADTINNVENVFVQTPAAGTWTVQVIADQVNVDGHVETTAVDADYALVVTAKTTTSVPPYSEIVDNTSTGFRASTNWSTSSYSAQKYGTNYRFATPVSSSDVAWYSATLPANGTYKVEAWYPADPGYNTKAPYIVATSSGNQSVYVNQTTGGGTWVSLGTFTMTGGSHDVVGVSRWTSGTGYVIADAVRITRVS